MKAAVLPVPVWAGREDVASGEHQRDGLVLDGCGFGIALVRDGAEEVGRQAEIIEGQAGSCGPSEVARAGGS